MPITSKYTNQKIEQIISDVFDVLEKHDASAELALMVVGNIATNIINADVPASKKKEIAEQFSQALLKSTK
ncbi:hypothetical protein C9J48_18290 [Photobacterium profundum]|jgi:uncharacterized protein|uniref:UPF0352 protein PBPRA2586 n=4 Tax=Photobacterium TaxID=657 RepID=Y2586_PHOPR|nr:MULTISPECIES: DUF1414 domain-containing protein [Photobacterium]Q6LP11.1 RecName: Full=UPF0352 protein PBPRA2586 [Photobacterium profundum SS9]EAS44763.1 hypothetical protein P3TCK_27357 [Photobacterium profundum 3TCK]PSU51018.1 hypothetical protein C9J12_03380 [Photobacterium frigidiphilum]PSV46707.1 hypothetical protein C9J47_12975 [Photobacterium indicum]PSV60744.1 hypothetical protein C9J48_18290 [Photobacterium profundum]CAG20965.1 conserved hypothetical protein [Photobacterium profun